MEPDENPIVWIIDENERELRNYENTLQGALDQYGAPVTVEPLLARRHIGDYHDIVGNPRTVAIIVDQRLQESRGIDHTGIELAKRLRSLVPNLPIYILTNHVPSDDFHGSEWSVEDILSKQDMSDPEKLKTITARLIRRIRVHQTILEDRDRRYRELLRKSLDELLTQEEKNEFDELRFERTAAILSDEGDRLAKYETTLNRLKNLKSSLDE